MLAAALLLSRFTSPLPPAQDPDPIVVTANPAVLLDNYFTQLPSNCAGMDPSTGCLQTFVGIYYPTGMGPPSLGYTNPPAPVFINLRGGNGNPALPELYNWFNANVLPKGFVGVDPNYPKVDPGEDYHAALDGVATLIQYLRHNAAWLNIDPNKIFLFGRSFGGYLSFALGLTEDHQDLTSPDPLKHQSSRPNFCLPFSGVADLTCFTGHMVHDEFLMAYFPVALAPGATVAQKLADSPVFWVLNPQLYQRTITPPMCMGYHLDFVHPCGQIHDPHDGTFGYEMRDNLDQFVLQSNDPSLGLQSVLLDTDDLWGYWADMTVPLQWCLDRLAPQPDFMYLPAPQTSIGPAGSLQTLEVLGAAPGHQLHYYFGFASGPIALPFCPNIQQGLPVAYPLGSAIADAQGRAKLTVFAPPIAIGLPLVFHVADFATCRVTNLLAKTWTQ
ncbi:MAG: hypothetical protein EPO68_02620 [Planctomycetota bacterium]|nr:MAG: hypothetical protein EPO68_02620 [Planctomycetota bacterium]